MEIKTSEQIFDELYPGYFDDGFIRNSLKCTKWVKVDDVKQIVNMMINKKNNSDLNMMEQKGFYLAIITLKELINELDGS